MHYKLILLSDLTFRFCDLVYIYDILTHFDYDTARNLVFKFDTCSNDFNYWNIIEIEKLEIPRITESYIINLRFVLNAKAPGNVKEIPFQQPNPQFA